MAYHHKRRAKNFFLKKNLQGRIILAVFLAVTISCFFYIVVFGYFSADTMTISYKNNDLQMGQTPAMLFKNALAANWVLLLACSTILVIAAIIGTHRIAGPLYRFERTLESMIKRKFNCLITLREKDEGKDLAEKINTLNSVLSNDFAALQRHTRAIDDLLRQYHSHDGTTLSQDEISSILQAIKTNNDKNNQRLEAYTLADD